MVLYSILLVCFVMLCGCKSQPWNLARVQGIVTQAGRPLSGVEVVFLPDGESGTQGPRATGYTDEAGHYELRTDAGNDGANVGHYRVCLIDCRKEEEEERKSMRGASNPSSPPSEVIQLPSEYNTFAKTPLRAEVHAGSQTVDFEVPCPKK